MKLFGRKPDLCNSYTDLYVFDKHVYISSVFRDEYYYYFICSRKKYQEESMNISISL